MQYSGNSTSLDIVTLAEKKSLSNSVSFPILDKTLYANEGSKIIWSWIHEAYGGWSFDDLNQTDFPESTTTLTANQSDYALPVDAEFVKGVSIKNNGSSVWYPLSPVTLEQMQDHNFSESQFLSTASQPKYYRMIGNSIKLYPASNYTQAASLKLFYDRDLLLFSTTDTTKVPGWATAFHEALATYMALQYAKINATPQLLQLQKDWDGNEDVTGREGGYKKAIKNYYSRRFAEMFPPRITVRDYTRQNQ